MGSVAFEKSLKFIVTFVDLIQILLEFLYSLCYPDYVIFLFFDAAGIAGRKLFDRKHKCSSVP